ncbi:MAG: ATP-binding protein [Pontibacterium sp.]
MLDLSELFLIGFAYLAFLFGTAYLTERDKLPTRLVRHPLTHMLSIGVYASVWTFHGAFGLAAQSGYLFLASYLGAVSAFVLGPAILIPILRITRTYQLSSLADLFAFRFRSGTVGIITTILTVLATVPMISIQIQAIADALYIFNQQFTVEQFALGFCTVLALFSILFGARHATLRNKHPGLVVAMAVESLIKLIALVVIGLYAFFIILGGPGQLEDWLAAHPEQLQVLDTPFDSDLWRTLLIAFFSAAIVMPHMFHMMFTENSADETLYKATWGMPLFLLLLALAVPPIVWAGLSLGISGDPEFLLLSLGMHLDSRWLTILAFIGGLSAASGISIVATVSMASMLQNHILLPLVPLPDTRQFYAWILWLRRCLIILLLLGCYLFYLKIGSHYNLHQLGIIAVVAFLQFLPGLLVTLFWLRANRWGIIAGLLTGMSIWIYAMLLPLLGPVDPAAALDFRLGDYDLEHAALLSLSLNALILTVVSLLTEQNAEEENAANACLLNALQRPVSTSLTATRLEDFQSLLTPRLGQLAAQREIQSALEQLSLKAGMLRPVDLLRLRTQLEHNLTGLLGPIEAAALLEPLNHGSPAPGIGSLISSGRNVHLMENQLENYQVQLTGLAAELDELRRYHRLILQQLPMGVCTLDNTGEILFWNSEMELLTGMTPADCVGITLQKLPAPWGLLLGNFADSSRLHEVADPINLNSQPHWFSLHKAQLSEESGSGMVVLLENETATRLLQNRLAHSERLSSIGRFAAGVAHEIGNPVTGIACLAQNLKLETDNPEILETGDQIVDQTKRISRIVQSLVRFARSGQTDNQAAHESVNLHHCLDEAIHLVSLDSRGKFKAYINNIDEKLDVWGDAQQLLQVFVNLLNNACDASMDFSHIWMDTTCNEETISISITDEGTGIPRADQDRLFEPFFTTKDPGQGTGLGLSLVYNIIEEHYGSIEFISPANNKQNKGTRVVITLPYHHRDEDPGHGTAMG